MRFILAIILPWVVFFLLDRPVRALLALALQVTIIGWLPASIWAIVALVNEQKRKGKQQEQQEKSV